MKKATEPTPPKYGAGGIIYLNESHILGSTLVGRI
jgi:hypothetical protein